MDKVSVSISIPAVVINLARSRDRRAYMEAQLRGRGLDYHFFDATDGAKLTAAERALYDEQAALRHMGRPLTDGELACALSHIRVYEWMVKENIERLLVLEDDVCLKDNFFTTLAHADKWLPPKWGLINFLDIFIPACLPGTAPIYLPIIRIHAVTPVPNHYLHYFTGHHNSAICYLIHLSAAERLLSLAYPIRMVADDLTGRVQVHKLDCYTILPRLAEMRMLSSTIDEVEMRVRKKHRRPNLWVWSLQYIADACTLLRAYMRFAPRYPVARVELVQRVMRLIRQAPNTFYQKVIRKRIGALFSNRPLS